MRNPGLWAAVVVIAGSLLGTTAATAQETGVHVRSIRVLATDVEAVADFYKNAFGMSEIRRPVESPRFTEIIVNTGATPEAAMRATSTPIVIATRRADDPPAGGMAVLILEVPDLEATLTAVRASGGEAMGTPSSFGDLRVAFVTDPDGNQVELIMSPP